MGKELPLADGIKTKYIALTGAGRAFNAYLDTTSDKKMNHDSHFPA